jgi:isoleucyl-tRNA synthetase
VAENDLLPLDRYMLARTRELAEEIAGPDGKSGSYGAFEFHRIYHAVNEFAIVDLSAFYLDVLKDRMYTFAPTSHARRSAQTVLWQITEALVRLVAPILTFTADEIWEHLPAIEGREASVHLVQFPKPEEIFSEDPAPLIEEWKTLIGVRDEVLKLLEQARQEKTIGKALEADVSIAANDALGKLLKTHESSLKELFNVSSAEIVSANVDSKTGSVWQTEGADIQIQARPASGHKCARCWNFMPHVSSYGIWENVCDRCQSALKEMGIEPPQNAETPAEAAR